MSLLTLKDLKKHFGAQEVLRGASLQVEPGAKIGIVGRNGGGKTTLFHMITGEEAPDWGTISVRKGARMGFVPQRPNFEPGVKVRDHVEAGLDETKALMARLELIGDRMAAADDVILQRLMREHDELTSQLEELGGWETERRVETVLSGIGLGEEFWEREACTLSGGEKNRAALARALVTSHDLLLLDEPTNHLDLEGIEWLERYLTELRGAIMIISHDRRLLQNSVNQILELEFGVLTSYPGDYRKYLVLKKERYDDDLRRWQQQQDLVRKEESFIKKHMGSQRTAEAKGRAKKLSHIERLERPHHDVRSPVIRPPEAVRGGERVLRAEGLCCGYEDNLLFEGVDLRIGRGQRIGMVGPNGTGKTTLLKTLAGRLKPLAGEVHLGHDAVVAYYDQDTTHLREDCSPFSEIGLRYPTMTDLEIRSHLARFLFRGRDVDKSVSALSGGERSRLALAILVLTKPSWMALDEPTNHLDLASRTSLEEMLSEFPGALVCISHDREFLDGICDHVVEVSDGGLREYAGNYSSWREAREQEKAVATEERARKASEVKRARREQVKLQPQPRSRPKAPSEGKKAGNRVRNPYKFEKLEKRIMDLEAKLTGLHEDCAKEEVYSDSNRLRDTQFRIAEVERELGEANDEWANWG